MSYERYRSATPYQRRADVALRQHPFARQAQTPTIIVHDDCLYVEQEYVHTIEAGHLRADTQNSILVPPNRISEAAVRVVVSHF
jgi:hypothetical protein